jgi:hypothetical protein
MKFNRNEILAGIGIILGSLFFRNCLDSNEPNKDEKFQHIRFLDNPMEFKGDTLISTFHYNGTGHDLFKLGDMYQRYNQGYSDENIIEGYRFEPGVSNRLDVVFELPRGLDVPNVSYPDEIQIRFICTQGSHRAGNKVLSIRRKE